MDAGVPKNSLVARAAARRAWVESLRAGRDAPSAWAAAAAEAARVLALPSSLQAPPPPTLVPSDEAAAFDMLLLALGLAPFPPPLCASDGGFTSASLTHRLPAILEETLACNVEIAPPALHAAVRTHLCAPLAGGGLLPPPLHSPLLKGELSNHWGPFQGASERGSWWYQEVCSYRHLLHLWHDHGLFTDPFASQKRSALASAARAFSDTVAPLVPPAHPGRSVMSASLRPLILRSLWGNRADLSLSAGRVVTLTAGVDELLVDDVDAALQHLQQVRGSDTHSVTIVLDNCGLELLSDLALADALLLQGVRVTLAAKRWPTFVSDALPADVSAHIEWLRGEGGRQCPQLAMRLDAAMVDGTLRISAHEYWNSAAPGWEMPADLRTELSAEALAIFKGDANYRRLLGDRHWPHDEPFDNIVGVYAPCALLALRTLKAGVVCGLPKEREAVAVAVQPEDWLVSGVFGTAQFTKRSD